MTNNPTTTFIDLKLLDARVQLPTKATPGSAGFDLQAAIHKPEFIHQGDYRLIPTGIAIHIADPTIVGDIHPRSKKGCKGFGIKNLTGIIDSDYQGELMVAIWNTNPNGGYIRIDPLDTIAQIVFRKIPEVAFRLVSEFKSTSIRGDGGIAKHEDTRWIE